MGVKTKDKELLNKLTDVEKEFSNQHELGLKLSNVYVDKISEEVINIKLNNQLNSINASIIQINPRFNEKSKNYDKMKQQMLELLNDYECVLKQICNKYDEQIKKMILQKFDLETQLLKIINEIKSCQEKRKRKNIVNSVVDKLKRKSVKKELLEQDSAQLEEIDYEGKIKNIQSKIRALNKKINSLNSEKSQKVFEAMEVGDKQLILEIKKPKNFKKVVKFFANRFNTYKVINKNVFEPLRQRIDEFKI